MPTHEYERLARTALLEVTPDSTVGAFVDAVDEGDDVVSLRFANRMPGYPGWRWTVSVAKIGDDEPTVLEVELMPGDGSLVAPEWVPWSERLAEYRAAQEGEDGHGDDDESDEDDDESDDDEDADYDDPDDDEADDDESDDDDDDDFDTDEDDLSESDDDDLDGVDVDELDDAADSDDDESDEDDTEPEPVAPPRARRRRAQRVRPVDPDDDLEVDRLDVSEVDPDHHRS
ncbi:DUF3027 domain-containing protein [Curtobacterium sp. 458]|uniref:DUF3027 domain-containing protein n=1 Tax=Curtobacterium sp. 458 TaxID=3050069 RepID=UPI0025B3CC1A|nr:DUF3027 domain-containing protein [Curtobacterium sp. 458]WJY01472.1 DUF3027 domain-containing protein [Curtobacterium sp. 458]